MYGVIALRAICVNRRTTHARTDGQTADPKIYASRRLLLASEVKKLRITATEHCRLHIHCEQPGQMISIPSWKLAAVGSCLLGRRCWLV